MFKKSFTPTLALLFCFIAINNSFAAKYIIDTEGAHAFIQFRIKHLGYSWLWGRFDKFTGHFNYDEKQPNQSAVYVEIDVASLNSNHAERDKHLKGKDFFDIKQYPKASFRSTSIRSVDKSNAIIKGLLTLKDVSKEIEIKAKAIGGGADPWGGYRQGFEGRTTIALKDFNILYNLGPASQEAEIILSIEGVRQ